MKCCPKCKKGFDTEEKTCPVCGKKLIDWKDDENEDKLRDGELVAVMTALGLF